MDSFLAEEIRNYALLSGYESCGIIPVERMRGYTDKLKQRIEDFPESESYDKKYFRFAYPKIQNPWSASIVICVRPYGKYKIPKNLKGLISAYYLTDSRRNKNSKDYDMSIRFEFYLKHLGLRTLSDRDSGITALRWAALEAGLGIVGKNNCLYTERSGSWIHLEAWLIDRQLEIIYKKEGKTCPENCQCCIQACPTGALGKPYALNRCKCITYLSTAGDWQWPYETMNCGTKKWIYGCDICQVVCPMNKDKWVPKEEFPGLKELGEILSPESILEMDYKTIKNLLHEKFWYIPEDKLYIWKINALNAIADDYMKDYEQSIGKSMKDENEYVRKIAKWVMDKKKNEKDKKILL